MKKKTLHLITAALLAIGLGAPLSTFAQVEPCDEFISGGGWISKVVSFPIFPDVTVMDRKTHFAIQAGIADGQAFGHVHFIDPRQKLRLSTRDLREYIIQGSLNRLLIFNVSVLVNGFMADEAWVFVSDNGEPGGDDTFEIQLRSNESIVYWASGSETWAGLGGNRPGGGNIQLQVFDCE